MQTFLPYPDFEESARALSDGDLRRQCEIAYALSYQGVSRAPSTIPWLKLWHGHELALKLYCNTMVIELQCREHAVRHKFALTSTASPVILPRWMWGPIHASHRSNLLRLDREHYKQFGWVEPSDMPYFWPAT